MKRYRMERVYLADRTLSSLYDPDLPKGKQEIGKMLERQWLDNKRSVSCIPEGIYVVRKNPPKPGREYTYFIFDSVPGRSNILIHRGNEPDDSQGCLLACSRFTNSAHPEGLESTKKLAWMALNMPDEFELEIIKKPA